MERRMAKLDRECVSVEGKEVRAEEGFYIQRVDKKLG